jgi:hypothetical protein
MCRRITGSEEYAEQFVAATMHLQLIPYLGVPRIADAVFSVLYNVVHFVPRGLDPALVAALFRVVKGHETKVLVLFHQFARHLSRVANPWGIVDPLFKMWKHFQDHWAEFVNVLYALCKDPGLRQARIAKGREIVTRILADERRPRVLAAVFVFLADYAEAQMPIQMSLVTRVLCRPKIRDIAVQFLMQLHERGIPIEPLTRDVLDAVIEAAASSEFALALLCQIADTPNGAALLVQNLGFLEVPLPTDESTFRLAMVLASRPECRATVCASESLMMLICRSAAVARPSFLRNLLAFVAGAELSPMAVVWLKAYKFFEILQNEAVLADDDLIARVFAAFRALVLITFLEIPEDVFMLLEWELPDRPATQGMALEFLLALSQYKSYTHIITELGIQQSFAKTRSERTRSQLQVIQDNVAQLQQADPSMQSFAKENASFFSVVGKD